MTTAQDKPADNTTPPTDGYDEFSNVFDTLVENGEPAAPAAAADDKKEETSTTPVDKAAADAKAETKPAETTPAETTTTPAAAASPAEGEDEGGEKPAATPAAETPPAEDWKAKYDALVASQKDTKPAAEEPEAPVVPAKAEEPPPIYSADENEFLKEYAKEWPDVIKGEALRRRAEYRQLTAHIFSEVERVFGPIAARAVETAESFENDSTLRAIVQAHPDYDDAMYDDVVAWADGLKGYERTLAQGIIKEGSPRDVVDLVSRYKEVKGVKTAPATATATTTPAPAAPKASVTELPAAAKKAAKALGVVDSKRGATTPTSVDPNDFDQAWDEAVGAK